MLKTVLLINLILHNGRTMTLVYWSDFPFYFCDLCATSVYVYFSSFPKLFKYTASCMFNYRSVSLLTAFSKILEKVIHTKENYFLYSNNILADENMDLGRIFQ